MAAEVRKDEKVSKETKDDTSKGDAPKTPTPEPKPDDGAKTPAAVAPAAVAPAAAAPPPPEAAPAAPEPYVVAAGCSITTRRGILGAGSRISPNDFRDGQAGFDLHKEKERIVLESQYQPKGKKAK